MGKVDSPLSQWIVPYTNYFNFLIFKYFTTQIILKPRLAQLKLIFKFSTVKVQINAPLWMHMDNKEWRKVGKVFTRCYTVALKFWDEFNENFVSLRISSCSSKNMWQLYLKNLGNNKKTVHQSWFSFIFSKTFSIIRSILPWHSKKIVHLLFYVFQTKLHKAVNIFCGLPEWIKNAQMIPGFNTIKTWKDWRSKK